MSLLQNPEFENGKTQPWHPENVHDAVKLEVLFDAHKARTGSRFLSFRVSKPHASVAQEIKVTMPSVTALAYVRAGSGRVSGSLTISDLGANPDNKISAPIDVGETWTQVIAVLGMQTTGANRPVRVEFYLTTTDADMYIDSVTAF